MYMYVLCWEIATFWLRIIIDKGSSQLLQDFLIAAELVKIKLLIGPIKEAEDLLLDLEKIADTTGKIKVYLHSPGTGAPEVVVVLFACNMFHYIFVVYNVIMVCSNN